MYQIITKYCIPANVLTDRHSIFNYKRKDSPTDADDTFTQFSYACHQLGIQLEVTSVPQSKGRIERLNGSFQYRLCPLLRINNIKTIEEANAFLPSFIEEYNQRFALQVDNNKNVFVKQDDLEELNLILSVKDQRVIQSGHIIKYKTKRYIPINENSKDVYFRKGTSVLVIEAFDGNLYFNINKKKLYFKRN